MRKYLGIFIAIFFFSSINLQTVSAQFGGNLGGVSGTITWGTEQIPSNNMSVLFVSQTNGFTVKVGTPSTYTTGFILPPDTYTATASIGPNAGEGFVIGSQTVLVTENHITQNVNFDMSLMSGLVKGNLKINGILAPGTIQFCSSNPADPCPDIFVEQNGPIYGFPTAGFSIPMLPGTYRAHVATQTGISVGIVSITVVQGQINQDASLQYALELGAVTGRIRWGEIEFPTNNTGVTFQSQTSGFTRSIGVSGPGGNYNTGFSLPEATYSAAVSVSPSQGNGFVVGTNSVSVLAGQTTTNVDFDASLTTGLLRGTLTINGTPAGGEIQICSPNPGDPCPDIFSVANGPIYQFSNSGYIVLLQPGQYRMHVITSAGLNVTTIPLTVVAGQIIDQNAAIDLASISGNVLWNNLVIPSNNIDVRFSGQNTGFNINTGVATNGTYSRGFSLPADTYSVVASIGPNIGTGFTIGTQTVSVVSGQSLTGVNFDASAVSGLVRGNLKVNGVLTQGKIQFCSPNLIDPCPNIFNVADGPIYQFSASGFAIPLLPGEYRIHVVTTQNVDMGLLPITVVAGEILDLNFQSGSPQLTSLSPVNVWVGLKNSDSVGIKFDLLAEVYKTGEVIASGNLESVSGGSSGFGNANLYSIPVTLSSPIDFPSGSVLQTRIYVRNACVGSGKNSGLARLWFNDGASDSSFQATIAQNTKTYYLLGENGGQNTIVWNSAVNFLLGQDTIGSGPKNVVDVQSGAKCSPYKLWGTWNTTL